MWILQPLRLIKRLALCHHLHNLASHGLSLDSTTLPARDPPWSLHGLSLCRSGRLFHTCMFLPLQNDACDKPLVHDDSAAKSDMLVTTPVRESVIVDPLYILVRSVRNALFHSVHQFFPLSSFTSVCVSMHCASLGAPGVTFYQDDVHSLPKATPHLQPCRSGKCEILLTARHPR